MIRTQGTPGELPPQPAPGAPTCRAPRAAGTQYLFPTATARAFTGATPTTASIVVVESNDTCSADYNLIELDFDGIDRTVTAKGTAWVEFTPPDDRIPLKSHLLSNWKTNTNFALDLSLQAGSPAIGAASDGGNIGSSVPMPQFTKGDFTGDMRALRRRLGHALPQPGTHAGGPWPRNRPSRTA